MRSTGEFFNCFCIRRYRLAARHFRDSQSILPFEIQFPIHDIIKVDGSTNEFILRATIQLDYQFEFLHWDSNDTRNRYHDIDEILLPKTILQSLWLPDINLTDEESISFNIEHESAKINRHGSITWIRRGLFTILSPIDLTYYPFDRQYIHINMHNKQKTFKLQYQDKNNSKIIYSYVSRSLNLWTRLFTFPEINSSNISLQYQLNNQTNKPILSRGWFVRILGIEPKINNGSLENLNLYILIQRRRESHIYTTILPTLFFSVFIFIFYFSSIESYQRLIVSLLNILATLLFLIHLDRKISAEQLSYTPLIIRYLSIIFLIEILSLLFDHIIHSVYYGGIHFVSNWLHKKDQYDTQPPRLSHMKFLTRGLHDEGTDLLMKQFIEREESLKIEDHQRFQWRKQARLSECLCCWFFLIIIIIIFISIFFILPTIG
jgi:hypothetical protein